MLVTLHKFGRGDDHKSHAVVLEKCLPDAYQLKNSYESDPIITIPKNRKTFYQHVIKSKAKKDFNLEPSEVQDLFSENWKERVKFGVRRTDWILSDEAFSFEFRLCKKI